MKKFYFTKEGRIFAQIVTIAQNLEKDLSWVTDCTNGMDRIVEFFQKTSVAQDEFTKLIKEVQFKINKQNFISILENFFRNAGRCKDGWNRTNEGEVPSSSNVFINMKAPYDELFTTRSVYSHLSRRNNPIGEVDYAANYAIGGASVGKWNETGLIEDQFVNPFMKKNYKILKEAIKEFQNN